MADSVVRTKWGVFGHIYLETYQYILDDGQELPTGMNQEEEGLLPGTTFSYSLQLRRSQAKIV